MNRQGIGVLGGTFDPPHIGHLILAETAREQLNLGQILFVPAGQPPHKSAEPVSDPQHRLEMTRLAVLGNPAFQVDTTDIKRPPPHYTLTLLPLLQAKYPGQALWLLIGGDSLRDLLTWHQPAGILAQCRLAALARPGATVDFELLEDRLPDLRARLVLLDGPEVALSATQVRRWVQEDRELRYVLPSGVRDYVTRHRLYRTETQTSSDQAVQRNQIEEEAPR